MSTVPHHADLERISQLNAIGIALSAERDHAALLERILSSARELTHADAGTLYMVTQEGQALEFAIVQNDTLHVFLGGRGNPVDDTFPLIKLYQADGSANDQLVVAHAVLHDRTVNIADAYQEAGFDFSGTRHFDQTTGYRSRSFLTVPMHNHEGDTIAVLQLINKLDNNGVAIPFDTADQEIAESLASQAAVAITNQSLINDMQALFDSFIRVIATAIDAKSPHTGAHCRRVPDATLLLAEAAHRSSHGEAANFQLTDADRYELKTAAWLHDCGKVVTPPHVMEKATKLEGLFDRLPMIETRFEILHRDLELARLREENAALRENRRPAPAHSERHAQQQQQLNDDLALVRRANTGGEFMQDSDIAHLRQIATRQWQDADGNLHPLLSDDELDNLCIRRGTLNTEERRIVEGHMTATLNMLSELPFPRHLQRVPEYAGGHHERMDGRGYPNGLTREQMSLPARMMAIADVFEALTAPERPYKQPMPLSQALTIMGRMVEDNHLDPDLFAVFVQESVYLSYARQHLAPEQIDPVDISALPGLEKDASPLHAY